MGKNKVITDDTDGKEVEKPLNSSIKAKPQVKDSEAKQKVKDSEAKPQIKDSEVKPVKASEIIESDKDKNVEVELTEQDKERLRQEEESSKEQLEEAGQQVEKQKSKKKKIWNAIFFIVNIVVVVGILAMQISKEEVAPIGGLNINVGFLVLTFLMFGLLMVTESVRFQYLIKKDTGRNRPALAFKTAAIGRYYDCITPMASGGQPFQVFYLKAHDIKTTSALSIPITKYVFAQIAWVIVSFIAVIVGSTGDGIGASVVSAAGIIGFILSFLVIFVVLIVSCSKTIGKKLVYNVLKLLHKMKIVKNFEKQYTSVMKTVSDYQVIMRKYAKSKGSFLIMMFLSFLGLFIMYSIPFFIYCTFAGFDISSWGIMFAMSILIDLAASFIPLPGGTGVSELSFTALFGTFFKDGTLFWALIFWRVMSYYIYIVQGLILIIYDTAHGKKKYQWYKKKYELEGESREFKQVQIQKFRKDRSKRRKKV